MDFAVFAGLSRRDRALFVLCADHARTQRTARIAWNILTHLGGATLTIFVCVIPIALQIDSLSPAAYSALKSLVASHIVVQLIKRYVRRPRPSVGEAWNSLVNEPDKFSFPSGHSAAAMSVAFAYAIAFPSLSPVLIGIAIAVGASRVFLGVHYPGDVLAGLTIAVITGITIG